MEKRKEKKGSGNRRSCACSDVLHFQFSILHSSASSAVSAVRSSPPASRFTSDASRPFGPTDYCLLTTGRLGGQQLTFAFDHQAGVRSAQQVGVWSAHQADIERRHLPYSDRVPALLEPDTVRTRSAHRVTARPKQRVRCFLCFIQQSEIRNPKSSGPAGPRLLTTIQRS